MNKASLPLNVICLHFWKCERTSLLKGLNESGIVVKDYKSDNRSVLISDVSKWCDIESATSLLKHIRGYEKEKRDFAIWCAEQVTDHLDKDDSWQALNYAKNQNLDNSVLSKLREKAYSVGSDYAVIGDTSRSYAAIISAATCRVNPAEAARQASNYLILYAESILPARYVAQGHHENKRIQTNKFIEIFG